MGVPPLEGPLWSSMDVVIPEDIPQDTIQVSRTVAYTTLEDGHIRCTSNLDVSGLQPRKLRGRKKCTNLVTTFRPSDAMRVTSEVAESLQKIIRIRRVHFSGPFPKRYDNCAATTKICSHSQNADFTPKTKISANLSKNGTNSRSVFQDSEDTRSASTCAGSLEKMMGNRQVQFLRRQRERRKNYAATTKTQQDFSKPNAENEDFGELVEKRH